MKPRKFYPRVRVFLTLNDSSIIQITVKGNDARNPRRLVAPSSSTEKQVAFTSRDFRI